jgi:MFS family permease
MVALGLPAGALGVAWPGIQSSFGAPVAGLGLMLGLGSLAALVTTVLTGFLNERLGPNGLTITSSVGAALTLIAFSLAPTWWFALATWVALGLLTGPMDVGINATIARHRGIRMMGWLHASWALGAAAGPPVIGAAVALFASWRPAYFAMGMSFIAIASVTLRWHPYAGTDRDHASVTPAPPPARLPRVVVLGAALLFINFGFETSGGQWPFTQLTTGRGLSPLIAGWGATLYWLALTGGRVGLGVAGHRFAASTLLAGSAVLGVAGSLAFWLLPAPLAAIVALPAMGLSTSVVVPVVFKVLPDRLPARIATRATGYVGAAGFVGGASIPAAIGLAFQWRGPWVLGPALLILTLAYSVLQRPFAVRR